MASIAKIREKYNAFVKAGGKPVEIAKSSANLAGREIYMLMRNSKIIVDGKRLTLAEIRERAGIPVEVDKEAMLNERIVGLQEMLQNYVDAGHSVSELTKKDAEYEAVHNLWLTKTVDGKKIELTLEEKFAALGFPRKAKLSNDVRGDLIRRIKQYIADGGDIYAKKTDLPWFREEYSTYAKMQRPRVSGELAYQTNMRELGFDYSEMYYKFRKIENLASFKDSNGFVDSYRKDIQMDNFIKTSAGKLGLPVPVFVGLVGNADIKGCYLDTEYIGFVQEELANYLTTHDNLIGLTRTNKQLYDRLRHIANLSIAPEGMMLTTADVVGLLGFKDVKNDFGREGEMTDFGEFTLRIQKIAAQNGGKLSKKDLTANDYRKLQKIVASTGATSSAYLNVFDVEYDGKANHRLAKTWVDKYPYMQEMRAERDRILAEHGVSINGTSKKEDLFDVLIVASMEAFKKYKSQIFNFEAEIVTRAEKDAMRKGENFSSSRVTNKNAGSGKV